MIAENSHVSAETERLRGYVGSIVLIAGARIKTGEKMARACSTCGKTDCTSCDGTIEIGVTIVLNPVLYEGEILIGKRIDNAAFMVQHIKKQYRLVGVGICRNKKKPVEIYIDNYGHIYGISTILPYRYFDLREKMGE